MTLLVTGGSGFIGHNFLLSLRSNETVINLDKKLHSDYQKLFTKPINLKELVQIEGDIADYNLVSDILKKYQVRSIINFAAETHVDKSIHSPEAFIETNVLGTTRLLEAAREYYEQNNPTNFRFLHVSTDEVYGDLELDVGLFTEHSNLMPNSPYAASKAASDCIVRSYWKTYDLPVIITNCSNNYGPYQYPEKLIPLIINNALNEKPLPIYGTGAQIRDWLHVSDHCNALSAVLLNGRIGERYNIGGNNEFPNIEVVKYICNILEELAPLNRKGSYKQLINFVSDRPGHDRRYATDNSKITNELGWNPKYNFFSGLKETVRWYLNNRSWLNYMTDKAYKSWYEKNYNGRF